MPKIGDKLLDKNSFGPLFYKLQDFYLDDTYTQLQVLFQKEPDTLEERRILLNKAQTLITNSLYNLNKAHELIQEQVNLSL